MKLDLPAVTAALTTVPLSAETDPAALARLVRGQADRQALADLGVLYARAVDDHDSETLGAMFTGDGPCVEHAELATSSTLVEASYRYEDDYRCVEGRWLFARRSITFMYAVPADQLAGSFGGVERMRWPRTAPEAADYPESSPTWDTYRD